MVAQLRESITPSEPLYAISMPPNDMHTAMGFTRQTDGSWLLNEHGRAWASMAQRVLLSYVLRLDDRAALSQQYYLSIKQIQDIVVGRAHGRFTAPLREQLIRLGIGNGRMHRDLAPAREAQIRAAFERLAVLSADMLRDWSMYTNDQRQEVATDLYLLSGAWREESAVSEQHPNVHLRCADCGAEMLERANSVNGSRFLGCSRYPACTHTQKIPAYLEALPGWLHATARVGVTTMIDNGNGTAMAVRDEQNTALANHEDASAALSHILGTGDLAKLSDQERVGHYLDVCSSLGLNPRTRPFDWIEFYDPQTKAKKLTLYPNRSCAEQLRRQHQISVRVVRREPIGAGTDEAMFVVEVEGTTPTGRTGTAIKYVPLIGNKQGGGIYRLSGAALANAYMKAETGVMRRLTFSMVGMASPPDMDELSRPKIVVVDGTGRVLDNPSPEQKALAADPDMARVLREPTFETTAQAADAPLSGHASQAVRSDELEPTKPTGPKVSLRCDANKWRAAYFGATADTHMKTAEGRREFLARYTADYTPALRTDSLSDFLKRATDSQAEQMTVAARAAADDLRADQVSQHADPRVHASVLLTGGAASVASNERQEEEPEIGEEEQHRLDMLAELERDRAAQEAAGVAF